MRRFWYTAATLCLLLALGAFYLAWASPSIWASSRSSGPVPVNGPFAVRSATTIRVTFYDKPAYIYVIWPAPFVSAGLICLCRGLRSRS